MKNIFTVLIVALLTFSCTSEKKGNMVIQGTIKGLKKGKLYLQKMQDTVLVSVDSVSLLSENKFRLTHQIDENQLFYLTFDGNTTNKRILFFGEEGVIIINDKVKQFGFNPEISGSKNQAILDKFNAVQKRFNNQRLDFVKQEFDAKKDNNEALLKQLELDYQKMLKRKVLYVTNFAIQNADTEVAPYLGLTEMYDASYQMLDTVNKSMSKNIKKSMYGKRFQKYVSDIKTNEVK